LRVDLTQNENWENTCLALNQELDSFAGKQIKKNTRAFKGLNHAIYEIAVGNGLLYSHKRAVGFVNGNTPFFKDIKPVLYKDGFSVQSINLNELTDVKVWLESLKKETNYVLYSSDHPLTSEIFSEWKSLDKELNDKKIFSIRISHSNWQGDLKDSQFEVLPYSIHIFSITPELAIAICGEKFKAPPLIASNMYWDISRASQDLKQILNESVENPAQIKKFEANLSEGWKPLLSQEGTSRFYDRALIYNESINSEAIFMELAKSLKFEASRPGFPISIESANLCRWGGVNLYDQWWLGKPHDEVMRGLLVLSLKATQSENIKKNIEAATLAAQI
jgi:hypothetical protein